MLLASLPEVFSMSGSKLSVQAIVAILALPLVAACTPRVVVEAPKEPITINLNIKLDADIRLQIEEQAKQDVETNPIF